MSATLDGLSAPFDHGPDRTASIPAPWLASDKARSAAALVLFGGLLAGSTATLLPRAHPAPQRTLILSDGKEIGYPTVDPGTVTELLEALLQTHRLP
jgi:hypothetical protein